MEQSFGDFELWILENSVDDGKTRNLIRKFADLADPRIIYRELEAPHQVRVEKMVTPWLLNWYYQQADGEFIFYLSDDDLFQPGLFQTAVSHFDNYPEHEAVYFHLARTVARNPGEGTLWAERFTGITADKPRGVGQVDCIIDGGQIAYRKHVLNRIEQPWFYDGKEPAIANHADGLHLEALAQAGVVYHPLNIPGVIHRHTPVSTWSKDR